MNRKRIAIGAAILAGVVATVVALDQSRRAGTSPTSGAATGVAEPLNVLIVIVDDMGTDKVSSYAGDASGDYAGTASALPTTTTVDSLAAAGVRFTDAWANASCSPTRATMLTGTYAYRHGVGQPIGKPGTRELEDDAVTLADVAKDAGYATGLFGKWHLGEGDLPDTFADGEGWEDHLSTTYAVQIPPTQQGFDQFNGTLVGELDHDGYGGYVDWLRLTSMNKGGWKTTAAEQSAYATQKTTDDALAWIRTQTSKPWLAVVSYHAPHTPIQTPPAGCHRDADPDWVPSGQTQIYRAMAECMDVNLETLLTGIADLDDTLIFFVGDNGTESTYAEGVFADGRGKGTLYESGVRVPAIVADGRTWLKGRPEWKSGYDWMNSTTHVADPGLESAEPVGVVDIFATVAEVIGADASSALDSISLVPLLRETDGTLRTVNYTESFDTTDTGQAALRKDQWKMIVRVVKNQTGDTPTCRSRYELFDLNADRFETTDVGIDNPDALAELKGELATIVEKQTYRWLDVPDCPA